MTDVPSLDIDRPAPAFGSRTGTVQYTTVGDEAVRRHWRAFDGGRLVAAGEGAADDADLEVIGTAEDSLLVASPSWRRPAPAECGVHFVSRGGPPTTLLPVESAAAAIGATMVPVPGLSVIAQWRLAEAAGAWVDYWQAIVDGVLTGAGWGENPSADMTIVCSAAVGLTYLVRATTFLDVLDDGMVDTGIIGISAYSSAVETEEYRAAVSPYVLPVSFWLDEVAALRCPVGSAWLHRRSCA